MEPGRWGKEVGPFGREGGRRIAGGCEGESQGPFVGVSRWGAREEEEFERVGAMTLEKAVSLQRRMMTRILPIFFLMAGSLAVAFSFLGFWLRREILSQVRDETVRSVSEFLGEYGETLSLLENQYTLAMNSILDSLPRIFVADTSAHDVQPMEVTFFARQLFSRLWSDPSSIDGRVFVLTVDPRGKVISSTLPPGLPALPPGARDMLATLSPGGRAVAPLYWDAPSGRYYLYGFSSFPDDSRLGVCLEVNPALPEKILSMIWQIRDVPFVNGVGLYDPADGRPVGRHSPALPPETRRIFSSLKMGEVVPVGGVGRPGESSLFLWSPRRGGHALFGLDRVGVLLQMDLSFFTKIWQGALLGGALFLTVALGLFIGSIARASREVVVPFRALGDQMERFMRDQDAFPSEELRENSWKIEEIRDLERAFLAMAREIVAGLEQLRAANDELKALYRQQERLTLSLERVFSLASAMADAPDQDEEEFLSQTLRFALELVPEAGAGTAGIVEGGRWHFVAAEGHDRDRLRRLPSMDEQFLPAQEGSVLIPAPLSHLRRAMTDASFELFQLATLPVYESLVIPLRTGGKPRGHLALDIVDIQKSPFSQESLRVMEALGHLAATFLGMKQLFAVQEGFQREIAMSMISMLEQYDSYTRGHSENVALLAQRLAERLGMGRDAVKNAYWAGLVHDIGKILVPIDVLNKSTSLTEEEYALVKTHPERGERVLSRSEELAGLGLVVGSHHERWDGTGYPAGRRGEEIPPLARVMALADAYDAMTSHRSYRRGMKKSVALEEIRRGAGTQFDPEMAWIFVEMMEGSPEGS